MKIYTYQKCSTCKKATKWLQSQGIDFQELPIRDQPPSTQELRTMLLHYDGKINKLFNTSGMDYRQLGMKDKLPNMSEEEAIALLAQTGNLVKRPFALTDSVGAVGFKEAEWADKFAP